PAIELLEPFFRAGTLSARGLHALARAYGAVDRPADAGPLFENLLAQSPGNFQLLRSYIRFLGGCGDHDRAREIHECARAKLNNQQRLILELVLCTEIGDYERLLELAALANPDAKSELKDLIDQAIRRCTDPLRNVDMAKRLLS